MLKGKFVNVTIHYIDDNSPVDIFDAQASLAPTPVRLSVRESITLSDFHSVSVSETSQRRDDIVVADMVAEMVANMEVDKVADKVANMVADVVAEKKNKTKLG